MKKYRTSVIVFFIGLLLLTSIIIFIQKSQFAIGWDFQNNLWAPAHRLLQGKSPYHIQEMIPNSNAVWMPMVISLFLPMGWFPVQQASNGWLVFTMAFLFGIVGLFARVLKIGKLWWFAGVTIILIFFPPVLTHFFLGQISILVCLLLLLTALYWEQFSPVVQGLLFAIALTKPQLAIVFIPIWSLVVWKEKKRKQLFQTVLFTCLWVVALTIPFFLISSDWTRDFSANLVNNKEWAHPSVTTYLIDWLPVNRYFIIVPVLLTGMTAAGLIAIRLPAKKALLWSLALTPLFSPYIWSWDFVLLLPLLLDTMVNGTKATKWFTLTAFLVIEVIYFISKARGALSDHLYWWVPWAMVGVIIVGKAGSKLFGESKDSLTAPIQS